MTLCFGVFATILKMAASESVMNRELVSKLVATIDPDHLYGDGGHEDAVSKLMNGTGNFPRSERSESFGAMRDSSGSTTCIIPKSHGVSPEDLTLRFEEDIVPLLNEDRKAAAIGALQHVIKNDTDLRAKNIRTFEGCIGLDYDSAVSSDSVIVLPRFLAGMFLYVLSANKNDKASVKAVKEAGFFDSFLSTLVTYTSNTTQGFTVAPDVQPSYLERLDRKYSEIKVLIFKNSPRPFYDLYVPGAVRYGEIELDSLGIMDILRIGKNVIFTGPGGQGKTMLMRHLLLDALRRYAETGMMPIFISVKDFDGSIPDILQCAHAFIRRLWPELSMDELQTMFIDGKVILLFDGLDEIRPSLLSTFTAALNEFLDRYLGNAVILSSRPYENFVSFSRCKTLTLLPFSQKQAVELAGRLNLPYSAEFQDRLAHGLYDDHKGFTDNPLLLSIMLLTYDQFKDIPSKMHRFYQEAYQVLAQRHDKAKDLERPLATGWSVDTFADYFSYFCSITYQRAKTSFFYDAMSKYFGDVKRHYRLDGPDVEAFIKDLCGNICLMNYDGKTYDFIHRSFQEYFCARFLYHQDKAMLEKVIPLFDRRDKTRDDDKTLMMLYDMEPEEVTAHMFVPYLKQLIEDCESQDGVWTFWEKLYSHLECGDGSMKAKANTAPDSRLYAFIADHYAVRQHLPPIDDLPLLDDSLELYIERDEGSQMTKRLLAYRDALQKETAGRIYHFDWEELKNSDTGRAAIERPDWPFMTEYEAVKKLYKELTETVRDEPDYFSDMF